MKQEELETGMYKAIEWFLWGLFMGMGWIVGGNLINFVGSFMHH